MGLVNEDVYGECRKSGNAISHEFDFEMGLSMLTAPQRKANPAFPSSVADELLYPHSQGHFAERVKPRHANSIVNSEWILSWA